MDLITDAISNIDNNKTKYILENFKFNKDEINMILIIITHNNYIEGVKLIIPYIPTNVDECFDTAIFQNNKLLSIELSKYLSGVKINKILNNEKKYNEQLIKFIKKYYNH